MRFQDPSFRESREQIHFYVQRPTLIDFGWRWESSGPLQVPQPRVWVWLARKEELTVGDSVWTLCFRRGLAGACGRSGAGTETLNCLNHSPNSLFLQLTRGVETCRFTTQVTAAGCNGITGCCSSSDLPCPGAVLLRQGLPELQEWERQPVLPCKVPWGTFPWLCFLQPIASHVFHNYSTSLPGSLPEGPL